MIFISRAGVIGKKLGMTNVIVDGKFLPVTLVEIPKNYVIDLQKKEEFSVMKLGIEHSKNVKYPQAEEMKKKGAPACSIVKEFRVDLTQEVDSKVLDVSFVSDWEYVDIRGTSSGKGFAGCMKKWNFKGNRASHGASLSHRSMGSTGVRDKGWKGKKMPGRMGGNAVTVQSLKIVKIDVELGVLAVLGAVPGKANSVVFVKKAIKKSGVKSAKN